MIHLSHIIKGKNVPEFMQVEEICNKVRIHYEKSNGL